MSRAPIGSDDSRSNFETAGLSWSQRARYGELSAVFSPSGNESRNLFLHTITMFGANKALALCEQPGVLLDFGCGTGRMLRFFANHGWSVIGTEITAEMLESSRRFGLPGSAQLYMTDGVAIPLAKDSVDMIWVCGVLKYSLFAPDAACRGGSTQSSHVPTKIQLSNTKTFVPVYGDIAVEMYRVVKPGGWVVNDEVYVDSPAETFTEDFEAAGFITHDVRVLQRYGGPLPKMLQRKHVPRWCVSRAAHLLAAYRFHFDDPRRPVLGLRDYLFVWSKPK